jgi:outer membrane protein OmpA-like peptidoglycan-associated protein/Tol biopolymer transport system component
MKRVLRIYCLLIFLSIQSTFYANAQDKEVLKIQSQVDELIKEGQYEEALEPLLSLASLKPEDPEVAYKTGLVYFNLKDPVNALPYFEKAKNGGSSAADLEYYIGGCYHLSHKLEEAISAYESYKATLKAKDKEKLKLVNQQITYCKNGLELIKNPQKVTITNLGPGVNSKYADYVPAVSVDESMLVFTSRRENSTGGEKFPDDNQYYEDIYISYKENGAWGPAIQMGDGINTPTHDACVGISPDGQEIFLYKIDNGGDLYVSELTGSTWNKPKSLGNQVNSSSFESSASISADKKTLFFTSDRKGVGATDIYMTRKQPNGEWGKPILLGPQVNTPLEEESPFIHADGRTLYFSSKGHNSMGGYDIFSVAIDIETGEILSEPVNVGYPINTAGDDVFFVWSADNKRAYFSSEREGGYGMKDIYMLERNAKASLAVFKGVIMNSESKKPVAATILVTDINKKKILGAYNSNSSTGKYTIVLPAGKNYGISVEALGYLFYSKNIDVPAQSNYMEINDSIFLEKVEKGKRMILRNVFFDVNKSTLRDESIPELDRLYEMLKGNPTVKVQIGGYTDNDGNDEHNLKLSESRAKSVYDYLISKGIPVSQLTYKGFGKEHPIAPNDTPENKQLNRRTEAEIIE